MNNQQGDQAALDKLVDDCYGGKWPLAVHDLIHHPTRPDTVIYHMENESIMAWIKKIAYYETPIYPLAGTWVEGRLRELMGEAFMDISTIKDREWAEGVGGKWCCSIADEDDVKQFFADTSTQALVAALRVLKQKEVGGES